MPETPFGHRLRMRMEGLPGYLQERLDRENRQAATELAIRCWIAVFATLFAGFFYR